MANSLSSPYTRFDWLMKAMCNVLEKVVSECLMKVNFSGSISSSF
mgnify:FL=1